MARLLQFDKLALDSHYYLRSDDICFYLHEYKVGGDLPPWKRSDANQLICNFKIQPSRADLARHKIAAIDSLVDTLRNIIIPKTEQIGHSSISLCPVPPSRSRDDPDYDDRLLKLVSGISQGTSMRVDEIIVQSQSYASSHLASKEGFPRRTPDDLKKIYRLIDVTLRPNVFVFDDVIASGAHFRACKDLLLSCYPEANIYGIFLGRAV